MRSQMNMNVINIINQMDPRYNIMDPRMDPRIYIYETRKPRLNNPTYNSSNVDKSCFSLYSKAPNNHLEDINTSQKQLSKAAVPQDVPARLRSSSVLSNYGSSLLRLKDTDIYSKQNSKWNILNLQPFSHDETIKKYPKLTLQDKDAYYFRRKINSQIVKQEQAKIAKPVPHHQNNAGIVTYAADNTKQPVEMWQSYRGVPDKKHQMNFSPVMLNHVDQFRSIF